VGNAQHEWGAMASRRGAFRGIVTGDGLPVGREAETNEFGAFLDELAVAAAACLLEGEAGIGKTTL
jgi:MoxR-like ATPase